MSTEYLGKLREGRLLRVLLPLLLVHLTLLSMQIQDPTGTLLFRRWTLEVAGPMMNASSAVSRGAVNAWKGYFWLLGVRAENGRLHSELRDLELRAKALAETEAESKRLRELLVFKETLRLETIGARVVGRAPTPGYLASVLVIDRGLEDGVTPNAPVLVRGGVLGRILVVSQRNAQVQVITNGDAALGAMVERTRSPGVLHGTDGPVLRLDYIGNSEAIEVNDAVVTSGLDGVFPKGLPLGKVISSQKGNTAFRVIGVEPAVDAVRAEEVLVVINRTPVRL